MTPEQPTRTVQPKQDTPASPAAPGQHVEIEGTRPPAPGTEKTHTGDHVVVREREDSATTKPARREDNSRSK